MNDDLVERLLWHVEQVLGPVSDEPIVNEHDSDKAVLLFNFQAEAKRAIDYWYSQGRDDQYAAHADRIEALTAENERLREALREMFEVVCGETGFAQAVRADSGFAYPWPALDLAEAKARAALGKETAETFTRSDNV